MLSGRKAGKETAIHTDEQFLTRDIRMLFIVFRGENFAHLADVLFKGERLAHTGSYRIRS